MSVKEELRRNVQKKLNAGEPLFPGIQGYDETVIPELETALLAQHNILLLGLRGQAKTRIARLLTGLLDEWIPVVAGSEINDDPMAPLSRYARDLVAERGDDTPVDWLHRSARYVEKLATPDVSVADLIGDLDPIKAANLKLTYADERVVHFGLIPRSHRCIFVINELPDLQPRIQVALFNLLQEKDLQIRGFRLLLPLDIQFVFTANPEDYTNRGSIVTPLKDRIESQILTHYPKSLELSQAITQAEARISDQARQHVIGHPMVHELIERIAAEARVSEYVDKKSGVSARLTISAYQHIYAAAERRLLITKERQTRLRLLDIYACIPAITGKVELVYEGEQEGPLKVALLLINKALKSQFLAYFPSPEKFKRSKTPNPYNETKDWFTEKQNLSFTRLMTDAEFARELNRVEPLTSLLNQLCPEHTPDDTLLLKELVLHGLAEFSLLTRRPHDQRIDFVDTLSLLLNLPDDTD